VTQLSAPFIRRPIATTLLALAVMLAGVIAVFLLPVASLPQTEFPTIQVQAALPGADPAVMASSVATPLERMFGRIAGVTEMTSVSAQGTTSISLQFDLDRSLNGAARDVQAAINAARSQLPANLPAAPSYKKVNPAEPSILILVLQSDSVPLSQLYDIADTVLSQKIAQVYGVGQVSLNGSAKPAVRVEVNPMSLNAYGLGFERLRAALGTINVNKPKGRFHDEAHQWSISDTDQLSRAAEYDPLIVYSNPSAKNPGAAVRIRDIAHVVDSVENIWTGGLINSKPGIQIIVNKAPGANIIDTVDSVIALLPQMRASLPPNVMLYPMMDRTTTIRASIRDITWTLALSIVLVILVVLFFLREVRSTFIPSISVPLSLLGTFAVMKLCNYTIDNLSLMAITIATGFVVDDAIVVIENVDRHLRKGLSPLEAALLGSSEVGFTVLTMSISLVAAFLPMLLMGGIVGRLFREFAIVLSIAIAWSLVISLSVTPMLCAKLLKPHGTQRHGYVYNLGERALNWLQSTYGAGVRWVLRHHAVIFVAALSTLALTVYLYLQISKGFFPLQDTGRIIGQIRAAQDISITDLTAKTKQITDIVAQDPAVAHQSSFFGAGSYGPTPNAASLFLVLKSVEERNGVPSTEVMRRLAPKFAKVVGVNVILQQQQELNIGARSSAAQFQYTLSSDNLALLNEWAPKITARLQSLAFVKDATSDQLNAGLTAQIVVDHDTASRSGISSQQLDNTLYDAFGQRQVSTIYGLANQYHVVMEAAPEYQTGPAALDNVYVQGTGRAMIPLSAISRFEPRTAPLVVNHQGPYPAVTISFNLAPGYSLGDAAAAIQTAAHEMGMPDAVHGAFAGAAKAFQASLESQPILILLALITIYLVLGMLYESMVHPLTILSSLPSAGVGALLALMAFKTDFNVIAMIGIVLLIGIVQKNSIMLIDFALQAERNDGMTPEEAIYEACLLRFRPILMTTLTALLGALPLALGTGVGFELRRPLGISIVGGLAASLTLTLFSTPVLYLYFSRAGRLFSQAFRRQAAQMHLTPLAERAANE
jgi:hydrophobe/amphiphile efflux-1 (HAE1) family protein